MRRPLPFESGGSRVSAFVERVRDLLKGSLRDDLEAQMKSVLQQFTGHPAPHLRAFVSQDRLPAGIAVDRRAVDMWAADEEAHLDLFAQRWAAENSVAWREAWTEVVVLDTIARFVLVKPAVEFSGNVNRDGAQRSKNQTDERTTRVVAQLQFVGGGSPPISLDGAVTLGRIPSEGIVAVEDERVSRRHLALQVRGGSLFARDLRSRYGTLLNNAPLDPEREVQLCVGDVIQLGAVKLSVTRIA